VLALLTAAQQRDIYIIGVKNRFGVVGNWTSETKT